MPLTCAESALSGADVIEVVILGCTGSIGTQAADVIRQHRSRFHVRALAAGGANLDILAQQIVEFCPEVVALAADRAEDLRQAIKHHGGSAENLQIVCGADAATQVAGAYPRAVVLNGITGGVGLGPTLAALQAGSTLALANKESLVVGGALVKRAAQRDGQVVPVDSEHSAIAQALASGVHEKGMTVPLVTGRSEVRDLILTASGGPFRGKTRADLVHVTPEQAFAHPTWDMGPVVTINSSTLMNKGLELIEAHILFDIDPEHIVPVIHPQSIVHSGVTWVDGATTLQASPPDMRLPIALGMTWPERLPDIEESLRWDITSAWTFEPVDHDTFPALRIARQAVASSATHPAVYNAANEVCVDAFIQGRLPYLAIVDTVGAIVEEHAGILNPSLEDILGAQEWAQARAAERIAAL